MRFPRKRIFVRAFLFIITTGATSQLFVSRTNLALAQPDKSKMEASDDEGAGRRSERFPRLKRLQEALESGELSGAEGVVAGTGLGGGRKILTYLQFVESYVNSVGDKHRAIALAALGIRELFKRQGKPEDALPVMEEYLGKAKDQTERNIYLFLMRQSYLEAKNYEKALALSKQILQENSGK